MLKTTLNKLLLAKTYDGTPVDGKNLAQFLQNCVQELNRSIIDPACEDEFNTIVYRAMDIYMCNMQDIFNVCFILFLVILLTNSQKNSTEQRVLHEAHKEHFERALNYYNANTSQYKVASIKKLRDKLLGVMESQFEAALAKNKEIARKATVSFIDFPLMIN